MRVAMYYNNSDVRLEEMPVPEIGPGELLLKVEASGLCGSDVMEWYRIQRAPMVLGHEVSGEVVQVGAGVDQYLLRHIVHENASVKEAQEVFDSAKTENGRVASLPA